MKKILASIMCVLSFSCYAAASYSPPVKACPQALPTSHPYFCASFKMVAQCHCTSSGLPASLCQDINQIYNRMISIFGTVQRACEYQHDTSTQVCIDDWNCYRLGGRDSAGGLCASTGRACP